MRLRSAVCWILPALVSCLACIGAAIAQSNLSQSNATLTVYKGDQEGVLTQLEITPEQGWHLYWRYPGDSGTTLKTNWGCDGHSPKVASSPDAKKTLQPLAWPIPRLFRTGPLLNYGYDSTLQLDFLIPCDRANTKIISLDAEWLVCKEECIPQFGSFSIENNPTKTIPAKTNPLPTVDAIKINGTRSESSSTVLIPVPPTILSATAIRFIPDSAGQIVNAAEQPIKDGALQVTLHQGQQQEKVHTSLTGLLRYERSGEVSAVPVIVEFTAAIQPPQQSVVWIVTAAFLGGVLLNLMPCVFPVLGLKVYQLLSATSAANRRTNALLYSLGVILSMLVLAGVLISLRAAGFSDVAWGSQLQNPFIVYLLLLVFLLLGANLLGAFELGTRIQSAAGRVSVAGPLADGLLTVLVATPCTAPFMAGAVAYALLAPITVQLLVFFALGLGVAFPVLLVGLVPSLARVLPKPGAWMERLKQFLAWPILFSAGWLFLVLLRQVGADEISRPLIGLLVLAFIVWVLGTFTLSRISRWSVVILSAVLILGWAAPYPASDKNSAEKITEVAYAPAALESLRAANTPVFLDATALWCITCQVNKQLVIKTDEVQAELKRRGVVWMEADWTDPSEEITQLLSQFGRAGVPLNVYFPPGQPPVVFEPVLTKSAVLDSLIGTPIIN